MNSIKISVIVPSYNQGPFIENCIKSVLKQTYSNWELIIQDGASTDNTAEVCKHYAAQDNRIRFFSEKDSGFADAVNKGLDKAQGKFAVIQSSDDFFAYSNVFEDVIEIYNTGKNLIIITGASVVVDEKLNLLTTLERIPKFVSPENIYTLKDHFSQGATFFSLQRAKAIGKLNPIVDMVADTDFWIRMACSNPIGTNSIFQTSKIWGGVTVQQEQRSADLSKFYLGRAEMAYHHFQDKLIPFSLSYKKKHANNLIIFGIEHYKALNKDVAPFLDLYKELNNTNFKFPKVTFNFKDLVIKIVSGSEINKAVNSKDEMYSSNKEHNPSYSFNWFNS